MERLGPDRFKVCEKVRLWPLAFPFTYTATMRADPSARTLAIEAVVHGMIRIDMDLAVIPEGHHCSLREHLRIRSPLPVESRLSRYIRQQHAVMCKNLELAHDNH
jgi:hypothetical protein